MKTASLRTIQDTLDKVSRDYDEIAVHRNVILLCADRSQPDRTCEWLDSLDEATIAELTAVHDWKGGVFLFWQSIPAAFRNMRDIAMPDGDGWTIYDQAEV
ncbi:hypothetical protein [Spirosoma sp. KUDC1026]|uniref:hypothetical protein n=1 Tax=Spirosoma sp. KUDC1026 TaxID=2745947 RepID=UPI00159BB9B2|nr:hypothetical protein [Spirosoma sp. KUDC1026]QKZ15153.1 hypothetical protein HU175_22030 [Spirosoma sp. KUDC1026]